MKYLLTFLIGFGSGALLALFAANLIARQQPAGKALMVLMQAHVAELRAALREGRCIPAETGARLMRLNLLSSEIAWAFAERLANEPGFVTRRDELARLTAGLSAQPPSDCRALSTALLGLSNACDACHHAYRY